MHRLLILLALTFTLTTAHSHPGNTDAKGWHVDKETGKRHQHPKPEAKPEAKPTDPKKSTPKKSPPKKKK
jgi:hypothetical protein